MKIWFLLVDDGFNHHKRRPARIEVKKPKTADVEDIKEKVKKKMGTLLDGVELCDLCVWRTEGETALSSIEDWENILTNINDNDKNTIKVLQEGVKVSELRLSDYEILLVQVISMLHFYCFQNLYLTTS